MFRDNIQKVVDGAPGALAGVLMGFDGIAVDSYSHPDSKTDMNTVAMEFAHVIGQIRKAAEELEVGGVEEVTFKAERLVVVARLLTSEYFLACALRPDGNSAKARYLLRVAGPAIKAEL